MKSVALLALSAMFFAGATTAQTKHPASGEPNGGAMVTAEEIHKELANTGADAKHLSTIEMMGGLYGSGYTLGVADSLNNDVFCIPAGVSKQEILAVVEKFLNEHPDE